MLTILRKISLEQLTEQYTRRFSCVHRRHNIPYIESNIHYTVSTITISDNNNNNISLGDADTIKRKIYRALS